MIRPALGNAFPATLGRELCLDGDGRAIFDDDPDSWALLDVIEPTMCRIAELRVSLLSVSIDEAHVRAAYEVESFVLDSPVGVTAPRMGDVVAVEVGQGVHLNYLVELTHSEVLDGVDADIGEGELLLSLAGFWMVAECPD